MRSLVCEGRKPETEQPSTKKTMKTTTHKPIQGLQSRPEQLGTNKGIEHGYD
jgi:hypothetical protein